MPICANISHDISSCKMWYLDGSEEGPRARLSDVSKGNGFAFIFLGKEGGDVGEKDGMKHHHYYLTQLHQQECMVAAPPDLR